jgi:hypothetical protein
MKVSNYLKSIFSICGGSIKENGVAWVIFVLLLLSDWKIAILSWIIPVIVLTCLEIRKEKRREDWEIIFMPIVNFIMFSAILTSFVMKCFEKLKSIVLRS